MFSIVELSSDEDVPSKKRQRSGGTVGIVSDVISLDDDDSPTTSKIAITIEHERKQLANSKITIQIEEGSDRPTNVPNQLAETPNRIAEMASGVDRFLELTERCLAIDGSSDMRHVVNKKLRYYHKRADSAYISSVRFQRLVADKISCLTWDSANVWVHVKEVVDALRAHKTTQHLPEPDVSDEKLPAHVKSEITRLEERMRELKKLVTELEEQEVDLDDEEDSTYLRVEKHKERLVGVYKRLCRLRGARGPTHGRVHIERRAGQASGPAARLEEWVNKPLAAGNPPRFPDFHDVVRCVRDAATADRLLWSDLQIVHEARELFAACGRALQRKRQRREWRSAAAMLRDATDPADNSDVLRQRLAENAVLAKQREERVFDEFENKQMMQRLIAKQEEMTKKANETRREKHTNGDNETTEKVMPISTDRISTEERVISKKDVKDKESSAVELAPSLAEKQKRVELFTLKENNTGSNTHKNERFKYEDELSDVEALEMGGVRSDLITADDGSSDDCLLVSDESSESDSRSESGDCGRIDLRSPTPPENGRADAMGQLRQVADSGRAYSTRVSISTDDDSDCLVLE